MVTKAPCDTCGSKDNLTTHDDGGVWCYTPECPSNNDRYRLQKHIERNYKQTDLVSGTFSAIPVRRISQRTCEFFNYQVGVDKGETVQIANYGSTCQQIRTKDKKFYFKGDTSKLTLWGKEKWNNTSNAIIITEGQIDALSIAESQDCKWPVVSLPNGAASARKSLQAELDWLLGFKSIILCFDNDDAGKVAIQSCVDLFPPGKLKIASLSEKDANECLCKGKIEELTKIVWNAQEYRPDGLISLKDVKVESLFKKKKSGYRICYPLLNDAMRGLPPGRITTFYGLTGRGKTTTFKEILLGLTEDYPNLKVAGIFLEEDKDVTNEYLIAMRHNIAAWKVKEDSSLLSLEDKQKAHKMLSNLYLYDHFGSIDPKRLINILEYMTTSLGIEIVILDHLSMIFSGIESHQQNERSTIDNFMTMLRSMVERTGLHVITATQLKRRNRDKDSEGDEIITEEDARGSGSIEHISDYIIFLNRNKRGDTPNRIKLELYKNRYTGHEGMMDELDFDRETGRLLPKQESKEPKEEIKNNIIGKEMY